MLGRVFYLVVEILYKNKEYFYFFYFQDFQNQKFSPNILIFSISNKIFDSILYAALIRANLFYFFL